MKTLKKSTTPKKTKMTQQTKATNRAMRVTVWTGIIVFIVLTVSVVSSVLPFLNVYELPKANHAFFTSLWVSWIVGAALPTLVGYFAGEHDTFRKNRLLRHFNGILFAAAAFWLSMVLSIPISASGVNMVTGLWGPIIVNVLPALVAVAIVTVVGMFYAKQKSHQHGVLAYRPYQLVVVSATLLSIVGPVISAFTSTDSIIDWGSYLLGTSIQVAVFTAIVAIAYILLPRFQLGRMGRLTHASLLLGILLVLYTNVSIVVSNIFLNYPYYLTPITLVPSALVLISYILYLALQRRSASIK